LLFSKNAREPRRNAAQSRGAGAITRQVRQLGGTAYLRRIQ